MDVVVVSRGLTPCEPHLWMTPQPQPAFEMRFYQNPPDSRINRQGLEQGAGAGFVQTPVAINGRIRLFRLSGPAVRAGSRFAGTGRFGRPVPAVGGGVWKGLERRACSVGVIEAEIDLAAVAMAEMGWERFHAVRPRGVHESEDFAGIASVYGPRGCDQGRPRVGGDEVTIVTAIVRVGRLKRRRAVAGQGDQSGRVRFQGPRSSLPGWILDPPACPEKQDRQKNRSPHKAASPCSRRRISSGGCVSNRSASPVIGWTKPRMAACSA